MLRTDTVLTALYTEIRLGPWANISVLDADPL